MRYYDVVLGRFISCDPIEYWGNDINLYRYVVNNVLIFIDSLGFQVVLSDIFLPLPNGGGISGGYGSDGWNIEICVPPITW
jgi:uncharacterized protein RhaS with RHS repeats